MRLLGKGGWLSRGRELGGGLMRSWIELVRGLGQGFLDLLRAEWEQLLAELGVSARRLGLGVALLAVAAVVLFWLFGALVYFLIVLLAIWLPQWAAAGIVVLVLLLKVAVLAYFALRSFKRIENPIDTVARRFDDHLDWWEARLVEDADGADDDPFEFAGGEAGDDDEDDER